MQFFIKGLLSILLFIPLTSTAYFNTCTSRYNCGYLCVYLQNKGNDKLNISIKPIHTNIKDSGPDYIDAKQSGTLILQDKKWLKALEAEITMSHGSKEILVYIKQNYCFTEAGNITVQIKRGNNYVVAHSSKKGSFGDQKPGQVWVDAR